MAALVRAGASYYSDEYAVLDERGYVHPYPKLLSLRTGDGGRPQRRPASELGGPTGQEPAPVGLVLLTHYREGARWRPRTLSPGQAVLGMLEHTVPARDRPETALAVLGRVAERAHVIKSPRDEAPRAAERVLKLLDR